MANPKLGKTRGDQPMHYSVGALIKKGGKYLLIDRVNPPFGFAGIGGHVDENEAPEKALTREVKEETGLNITKYKLVFAEELDWNWCSKGIKSHYWYLFRCDASGELRKTDRESKITRWYSKNEIKNLKMEPAWEYWLKKLKIL